MFNVQKMYKKCIKYIYIYIYIYTQYTYYTYMNICSKPTIQNTMFLSFLITQNPVLRICGFVLQDASA